MFKFFGHIPGDHLIIDDGIFFDKDGKMQSGTMKVLNIWTMAKQAADEAKQNSHPEYERIMRIFRITDHDEILNLAGNAADEIYRAFTPQEEQYGSV